MKVNVTGASATATTKERLVSIRAARDSASREFEESLRPGSESHMFHVWGHVA